MLITFFGLLAAIRLTSAVVTSETQTWNNAVIGGMLFTLCYETGELTPAKAGAFVPVCILCVF